MLVLFCIEKLTMPALIWHSNHKIWISNQIICRNHNKPCYWIVLRKQKQYWNINLMQKSLARNVRIKLSRRWISNWSASNQWVEIKQSWSLFYVWQQVVVFICLNFISSLKKRQGNSLFDICVINAKSLSFQLNAGC